MSTIFMKLVGAIVVGGEVVRPPAIVEVTEAEAVNLAHRGKAVPATAADMPTAVTPSAENAKGEGEGDKTDANPLAGASDANPVDATVQIGDQSVPVQIVGQDADGTPVVTEASGEAIDAALKVEAPAVTAEAATATEPKAEATVATTENTEPKAEAKAEALTPTQKRAAAKAATAAAGK
ncbi:hypothetical protein [Bradyrhizobium yuanmingense]|uniref:hypothetical protein n=1 Tax=Bradyrhizobium yuanmingense TaxID=108015 RepID=UPI0004B1086D|nr:hypothetical protein [Bradyrhizobium yuanmingense]